MLIWRLLQLFVVVTISHGDSSRRNKSGLEKEKLRLHAYRTKQRRQKGKTRGQSADNIYMRYNCEQGEQGFKN
jgi:protein involved in sex pheromone biosynthesis